MPRTHHTILAQCSAYILQLEFGVAGEQMAGKSSAVGNDKMIFHAILMVVLQ